MSARAAGRWAGVCVGAGAVLVLLTIARTSLTQDEPAFFDYGARVLLHGDFCRNTITDNSKLPGAALNVVPTWLAAHAGLRSETIAALLAHAFVREEAAYITEHFGAYLGRVVTLGFYAALCGLVFMWGREIYGARGALAATALLAFLPTLLGHAGLVTADVAATCLMLAAVYALAGCFFDPSPQAVLLAGIAVGAAQLVKFTAVGLVPMSFFLLGARLLTAERTESRWRLLHAGLASLAGVFLVALVVVNAGFGFQGTGVRLSHIGCYSALCRGARALIGDVPLPLPFEYLNGLDLVSLHDQNGVGGGEVYLLGHVSRDGFASYYLIATVLKTPLPFLLLLATRPWRRQRRYIDLVLLVPVVWLLVHFSFFFHTQLGLRFVLPAFPFLALLAAAHFDAARPRFWRGVAGLLLLLQIVGTVVQAPRYLAYFNVLIGAPRNAYRYLADSNLDWGQDRFALWAWQREQPEGTYALQPDGPVSGLVLVRANDFVGVGDPQKYAWLRRRATPIAVVGDSYLLFDVQ